MNNACPDYYKMTPYLDWNHWAAQQLRAANWRSHKHAIFLDAMWVEMGRYVRRLPFKATNAKGAMSDIDKAISLLRDMREALQEQDESEEVKPTVPLDIFEPSRTLGCPVPWSELTPTQQSYIQQYRMNNEPWACWKMPDGDEQVVAMPGPDRNAEVIMKVKKRGGTLHHILDIPPDPPRKPRRVEPSPLSPEEMEPLDVEDNAPAPAPPPACPQCGQRLEKTENSNAPKYGDYRCRHCLGNRVAGNGATLASAYFWQHDLARPVQQEIPASSCDNKINDLPTENSENLQPDRPACPQCGGRLHRIMNPLPDMGDWSCVKCGCEHMPKSYFWQHELRGPAPTLGKMAHEGNAS